MVVTRLSPLLFGLLLAGCSSMNSAPEPEPAPLPPRVESGGECGAQRVQDRIGRTYSVSLGKAIHAESEASAIRVIRPGTAVTLDHRPDRINVHLDRADIILNLDCG
ncbi:I78 family peptidase inhibitor [uncultured Halomonas sp.]|uniref:I78 family peptidase inhibitor n=1 Tax=uncultured Halomonas sp. TaxID=173971 RepID=UPI00262996D4|nr:I78 family peptidase inhibitor [uncultured Halomonas sp.]